MFTHSTRKIHFPKNQKAEVLSARPWKFQGNLKDTCPRKRVAHVEPVSMADIGTYGSRAYAGVRAGVWCVPADVGEYLSSSSMGIKIFLENFPEYNL